MKNTATRVAAVVIAAAWTIGIFAAGAWLSPPDDAPTPARIEQIQSGR